MRIASAIKLQWLEEIYPKKISSRRETVFDVQRQCVVGRRTTRYLDLVVSEDSDAAVDAMEAGKTLAEALRACAAEIFAGDDKSATFLARIDLLKRHMGEHAWPAFSADELGDVLAEVCRGKRSAEEMQRAGLAEALEAWLVYPLDRVFRENAPEAMDVPSGSRIKLAYSMEQCGLAVRLQEIFGWTDTPRICGGRVAVLLHLLGPNYRVVQITDDLKSFWSKTYFQVRKDLRVRYPRHSWPDDPTTAIPQAKGGKKRA